MMHKLRLILLLGIFLVSPHLAAGSEPRYPVLDSKFPAAEAKLGWIDNERVMFHGYDVGKMTQPSPGEGYPTAETGLFIWDTVKGSVAKYWDIDGITPLCVYHDQVWLLIRIKGDENARLQVAGKIGKEVQTKKASTGALNGISCRYSDPKPEWVDERRVRRTLLEEHGYLDFGPWANADRSDAARILFYRPNLKEPLVLPLNPNRVQNLFDYVEFENAYLFLGKANTSDAVPVWLLKPEGTVTRILELRGKVWERIGWGGYFLTKKGLFLSGGRGDYASVGTRGGYLLKVPEETPSRIIAGSVRSGSVSPDGCKVAFVHVLHDQAGADSVQELRVGKPGTRTLKLIDLCKGD